LQRLPESAEVM